MFKYYNPNPKGSRTGDCSVRAISKALGIKWDTAYIELVLQGFIRCDMPSANHVWGSLLEEKGFRKKVILNTCPNCYTVKDFCKDNPNGIYILALNGHVVCIKDGEYYDSWDSGNEVPVYYYEKVED